MAAAFPESARGMCRRSWIGDIAPAIASRGRAGPMLSRDKPVRRCCYSVTGCTGTQQGAGAWLAAYGMWEESNGNLMRDDVNIAARLKGIANGGENVNGS